MATRGRLKYSALLAISLLASACGLSNDEADTAIDTVQIATKTDVPPGTKLVVAEPNATQSLPWNLANAGKDLPYAVEFYDGARPARIHRSVQVGAGQHPILGQPVGRAPRPEGLDAGSRPPAVPRHTGRRHTAGTGRTTVGRAGRRTVQCPARLTARDPAQSGRTMERQNGCPAGSINTRHRSGAG
jgi:hypothetical protein